MHINTHNNEYLTHRCRWSTNVQLCLLFYILLYGLSLNGWHAVLCITNNRHDVTITTHAIKRQFLIWMTTSKQPTKRRCSCVKIHLYLCLLVNEKRIHDTLIAVDRYLRLMGDKTIPDSAEPSLESFYPPFVAGIDLPHQGVVDSYRITWRTHLLCIWLSIYIWYLQMRKYVLSQKNMQTITDMINEQLIKVKKWLCRDKLWINIPKPHYIISHLGTNA